MANIYAMADTWDDSGTTFTGIGLNVTDTASASGSLLMDLQVGGTSKFSVNKYGKIVSFIGLPTAFKLSTNAQGFIPTWKFSQRRLIGSSTGSIEFTSGDADGIVDTVFLRDAAGTLAQRNSTNAQTFNLYNTYTDASNYERGFMRWNSNVLEIGTEADGTGSARDVLIRRAGVKSVEIQNGYVGLYNGSGTRTALINTNSGQFNTLTNGRYGFGAADTVDAHIYRAAAAIIGVGGLPGVGGSVEFKETASAPAAGSTAARIFAQDNGSGKTQLMVQFGTGAAQQIAIEP